MMGIIWRNCHECGGELTRSDKLIEGRIVVRCARCRTFWLDGDAYVVRQGEQPNQYVLDLLQARDRLMKGEEDRERAIFEASIDDPRWERI